jgi:predicted N-formylglutamate amidohydrolase
VADNFAIIAGDPASKVILHVPHSARFIPADVQSELLLNEEELLEELNSMTDSRTDEIALSAAEKSPIKPWLFINRFSRLVIDPERFPDDREIMNKVGMGAVYRKTSTGQHLRSDDFSGEQALLENYFHPYAKALEELVTSRLESCGSVTIVDVHSYRPEQQVNAVNHGQKRPAMCIGTDKFHTPKNLIDVAIASFSSLGDVYENEPYAGTYVPLKFYGVDDRVRSIMMETRANTFLDDSYNFHVGVDQVINGLAALISLAGTF